MKKGEMFITEFMECLPTGKLELPLYPDVYAGFPSPADDYVIQKLSIEEFLIKNPVTTFFARARGDSMIEEGIREGDLLVIDRSLFPTKDKIVIAAVAGEITVKKYKIIDERHYLFPANAAYAPIEIEDWMEVKFWGVVTSFIHKFI